MVIIGNLLITVATILSILVKFYSFIVLGSVLISWLRPDPYHPIVRIIWQLTEPVFTYVRSKLPDWMRVLPIDASPFVIILMIIVIESFVVATLMEYGMLLNPVRLPH